MTEELEILKIHFNNYSVILSTFLANISPNCLFTLYKSYIEEYQKQKSDIIIHMFISNALKYEKKILKGDDDFYSGKKYDNQINIFEFKSIWKCLNDQNKSVIKSYMKLLCMIARKYCDINKK